MSTALDALVRMVTVIWGVAGPGGWNLLVWNCLSNIVEYIIREQKNVAFFPLWIGECIGDGT